MGKNKKVKALAGKRAVAYYRSDIPDQSDEAILRQQESIRKWAREHGAKIIAEFTDRIAPRTPSKRAK